MPSLKYKIRGKSEGFGKMPLQQDKEEPNGNL